MSGSLISSAISLLRAGRLVGIPTETVYGLAADATNSAAIRRVFAAKGRPGTNPLIVHVADVTVARRYAADWPEAATRLAERFWPGPLTIILAKTAEIVPEVTAGLGTVGLRVPAHPLTLELLRDFDGPLAAPSANRSTRISPTTAGHVRDELGDAVDLILDGGPCTVGIESTVLDLSGARPRILRPGGVSQAEIERIIGPVEAGFVHADTSQPAASPGQHVIHYAPVTPAFRFERSQKTALLAHAGGMAGLVAVLVLTGDDPGGGTGSGCDEDASVYRHRRDACATKFGRVVQMPVDPAAYARVLYHTLRELDSAGLRAIYVELPPDEPRWMAVHDRLRRATALLPKM